MITLRKSGERGYANHGWLESYHSFSFANYYDPNYMGFRALRVINEDWIQGGKGFPTHGHQDMEIVTYLIEGALEHQDSLGTGAVIHRGEVQRMSAGTGIRHSEFNASSSQLVHLLQIWLLPDTTGLEPSYEQKQFPLIKTPGELCLLGSPDGQKGSLKIHQDVNLYGCILPKNGKVSYPLTCERYGWIQVIKGAITINDISLSAGDAAAIEQEENVMIQSQEDGEFLWFDLA